MISSQSRNSWTSDSTNKQPKKAQKKHTGMPESMKAGLEHYSGLDMSGLKVHFNSSLPSKHFAHAFTQGNQIYLGPGQRHQLGHEAWHAAQQMKGRVSANSRINGKPLNNSKHLEKEADHFAKKIENFSQSGSSDYGSNADLNSNSSNNFNFATSQFSSMPIQRRPIRFRIDENGKVRYAARENDETKDYIEMDDAKFAEWKGAGKRHGSNKWTDSETAKNYVKDTTGPDERIFNYDKNQAGNKGTEVLNPNELALIKSRIFSRERANRVNTAEFDIGSYKANNQKVPKYPELINLGNSSLGGNMNRDHIPSAASIKQRTGTSDNGPKKRAIAMAMDVDEHKNFTTTANDRNSPGDIGNRSMDTIKAGSTGEANANNVSGSHYITRKNADANYPARGFLRDFSYVLDQTKGRDTEGKHRKRMGAYRTMYRQNVKLHQDPLGIRGESEGINPQDDAFKVTKTAETTGTGGSASMKYPKFEYEKVTTPGIKQGHIISDAFKDRLTSEAWAKPFDLKAYNEQRAEASTKLQSFIRMKQAQKQAGALQAEKTRKEGAATKIQSAFRGYQARNDLKQQKAAATKIQSFARMKQAQKQAGNLREDRRNNASNSFTNLIGGGLSKLGSIASSAWGGLKGFLGLNKKEEN